MKRKCPKPLKDAIYQKRDAGDNIGGYESQAGSGRQSVRGSETRELIRQILPNEGETDPQMRARGDRRPYKS